MKREEMVSISVRESLGRTINTTLTTLVTIVTLYILGVDTIREVQPAHHYRHSGGRLQRQHDQRLCMGCSGGTAARPQEPEKA